MNSSLFLSLSPPPLPPPLFFSFFSFACDKSSYFFTLDSIMGSQWLYKPHGVKQTKEFFHFLFHSIKFHFLSPCNLLTRVLMALVTQGQKFSCRLSLYVFVPGRETVSSCFLSSLSKPCNCSPNRCICPCCELPPLQPSLCEGGKEVLE